MGKDIAWLNALFKAMPHSRWQCCPRDFQQAVLGAGSEIELTIRQGWRPPVALVA